MLSILHTWRNPDDEVAHEMLRNLSKIPTKKIILSPQPGPGSRGLLQALAGLLRRFASILNDLWFRTWLGAVDCLLIVSERLALLWRRLLQEDI